MGDTGRGKRLGPVETAGEVHGVPTVVQWPQASSGPGSWSRHPLCPLLPDDPHCPASCPCPSDVAGEVRARQLRDASRLKS